MATEHPMMFMGLLFVCSLATCSASGNHAFSVLSGLISSRLAVQHIAENIYVPYRPGGGFDMSHHEILLGENEIEEVSIPPGYELEENFDWAMNRSVVGPALNQQACGSCWAFSSAGAIASSVAINTGNIPLGGGGGGDFLISEQQLLNCAPNPNNCGGTGGCEGSTQALAFKYWTENGFDLVGDGVDETNGEYVGKDEQCAQNRSARPGVLSGWATVADNDMESLMFAVREIGPVAVSVDAGAVSKPGYKAGSIIRYNECGPKLDHAVLLVGYGCDGEEGGSKRSGPEAQNCWFKIRNSWGPTWGECRDGSTTCADDDRGFFRISRQSLAENAKNSLNQCAMDTSTEAGLGCVGANKDIKPRNAEVCGTCGVLYKPVVPLGARFLDGFQPKPPVDTGDECIKQGMIVDAESCDAQGCKCKINPALTISDCVEGGALEACVVGSKADLMAKFCFGESYGGGCDSKTGELASTGIYGQCAQAEVCKVCYPTSQCGTPPGSKK